MIRAAALALLVTLSLPEAQAQDQFQGAETWPLCAQPGEVALDLYEGLAVIFDPGTPVLTVDIADATIADAVVLTKKRYVQRNGDWVLEPADPVRAVYTFGHAAGRTPVLFAGADGEPVLRCVIEVRPVADLTAQPDKVAAWACKAADGAPLVLQVGRETRLDVSPRFVEISASNPHIFDVQPVTNSRVVFTGVRAGLATFTRFGDGGHVQETCIVQVE